MMTQGLFHSANDATWTAIRRLLRRVQYRLAGGGHDAHRGEAGLCRLSGLPSCCFSHFADQRR